MGRKRRNKRINKRQNVQAPAARGVILTNRGAMRSMTVTHREYVKALEVIDGGGPNQVSKVRIQPGDDDSFPWLSDIALRFESYKFTSLSLEYIPDVGTDTPGSVAICPDYDANDDNLLSSKAKLLAFEDTVRGPLWTTVECKCTRRNLNKRSTYYTAGHNFFVGNNLYDTGNFWISLNTDNNVGSRATVGELWMKYTIQLVTPQLEPDQTVGFRTGVLYDSDNWDTPFKGMSSYDANDLDVSILDDNTIRFKKPGFYKLLLRVIQSLPDGGNYFYAPWISAPTLIQDYGASATGRYVHGITEVEDGSKTNEVMEYFIDASNQTTASNPLDWNLIGLASDDPWTPTLGYDLALQIISMATGNEFMSHKLKKSKGVIQSVNSVDARVILDIKKKELSQARSVRRNKFRK